jgi:competence protein ComEC
MPTPEVPPVGSLSGRRLLAAATAFAAGIVAFGAGSPAPVALAGTVLAAVLFPWGRWRRSSGRAGRVLVPIACCAACLMAGAGAAACKARRDPTAELLALWRAAGFEEGTTPIRLRGIVADVDRIADERVAIVLRLAAWTLPPGRMTGPRDAPPIGIRLTVPLASTGEPLPWQEGDTIEATARAGRPRRFRNPGAFDYPGYLATRDITLTGSIKSARLVDRMAGPGLPTSGLLPRTRRGLVGLLRRAAADVDPAAGEFLAALLFGERQSLPPDLEETLQEAGVYHIIALSGFNVALVALIGGVVLGAIPLPPRMRRFLVLLLVALYWGLARDSGSIARASLMVLLHGAGALASRRVSPAGAIAVSAIILLGTGPGWLFDAGFQLSYVATLGLVLAGGTSPSGPPRRGRIAALARTLRAAVRTSAAALAATGPISARQFHSITPAGLAANLVAVPLSAVCLIIGLAVLPLSATAPGAARAGVALASLLLALLRWSAAVSAAIPGGFVRILPPGWWGVIALLALLAAGAVAMRTWQRRAAAVLAVALALILGSEGARQSPPATLEVTALDVGQGDAILVRFPTGLTMLVDAGGMSRGEFDVGARVVAPALRSLGLLRLDLLVVTHAHRDHIGGALSVLKQLRPRAVWLGAMRSSEPTVRALEAAAASAGASVLRPRRGVRIHLGGGVVDVLHPAAGPRDGAPPANDDSLVLRIASGGSVALLTGDIEHPVEEDLAAGSLPLSAGFLKVAHHGSDTSSTRAFLDRVAPEVAMISAGAGNPWGHPSPRVLGRLESAGAKIFRTDRDGAVRALSDGRGGWSVERLAEGPGASVGSVDLRSDRDEAENEDDQPEYGHHEAPPVKRGDVVHRPGVPGAKESEQRTEQDEMISAHLQAEEAEHHGAGPGHDPVDPRRDRVHHVPAIELAYGQQVQGRGEQSQPRRRESRVQPHRHIRAQFEEMGVQPREQETGSQADVARPQGLGNDRRVGQSVVENRQRSHEARDWPGHPDIEQGAPIGEGGADPDDRPEGPEDVRTRKEEWQRGVDPVIATREVVPHLVRAKDEHHQGGIGQPVKPCPGRAGNLQKQANR